MTQEAYVASIKKVLKGNKVEEPKTPEEPVRKKSLKYQVGVTLGVIAGVAIVVAFEGLLLLMLASVLGVSLTYLQCLALAFAISYFATKFK